MQLNWAYFSGVTTFEFGCSSTHIYQIDKSQQCRPRHWSSSSDHGTTTCARMETNIEYFWTVWLSEGRDFLDSRQRSSTLHASINRNDWETSRLVSSTLLHWMFTIVAVLYCWAHGPKLDALRWNFGYLLWHWWSSSSYLENVYPGIGQVLNLENSILDPSSSHQESTENFFFLHSKDCLTTWLQSLKFVFHSICFL